MPNSRGASEPETATSYSTYVDLSQPWQEVAQRLTTIPKNDRREQLKTRRPYRTRPGMKYGHPSLTTKEGNMFANKMTPFGTSTGTRSKAALRMMTCEHYMSRSTSYYFPRYRACIVHRAHCYAKQTIQLFGQRTARSGALEQSQ